MTNKKKNIDLENLSTQKKQEIEAKRNRFVEIFDRNAETQISNKLQEASIEEIIDNRFISDLKQLTNTQKTVSYIESLQDQVEELLGIQYGGTDFNIDKYKDLTKNKIAQRMAEFAVQQMHIHPIDMDQNQDHTLIYKYETETGLWHYYSKNRLGRLCKLLADDNYSQHLEREFTRNIVNHGEVKQLQDMGLPSNEILLDNKRVLMLDTAPNYDQRQVTPEDEALYKLNVEYKPSADCPEFKEFINYLLNYEENQIKTLQEFMGWLLKYPNNDFKKALLILGVTNSGKSQLIDILMEMFNQRATTSLSMSQLGMERRFHVDKLRGSIINIDRDMSAQEIPSEDTIKQILSQEPMNVEPKGEDSFMITPQAKHIICSNVSPKPSNENDGAFYGRFLTLKAPNKVPKEDRVPNMGKKLFEKEGSGILNWMLEGLERLETQGDFTLNPSPYETKQMWMEYGNSVQRFVWENIERGSMEDDYIPKEELYEEYELWVEGKMMKRARRYNFVEEIERLSYVEENRRSVNGKMKRCFTGLKVDTDSGNLNT